MDLPIIQEAFEATAEAYLSSRNLPGLAVALVMDGTPVSVRGFGSCGGDSGSPVTGRTLFHIASVSKTFVATEILKLAEQGRLEIDRPVADYLPYFAFEDSRYRTITIGNMLSHGSGLCYSDDSRWGLGPDDDGALERYVRSLAGLRLTRDPGTVFHYNNTCFEILGALIAVVRGITFEDALEEDVLKPLGMAHSSFLPARVDQTRRAWPHVREEGSGRVVESPVYPYNRKHGPSSTLHTSAEDLCRYLAAYLGQGGGVLRRESIDLAFTPRLSCGEERPGTQVGLSWFLGSHRDVPIRTHGGNDTGFSSRLFLAPGHDLGIAILCNCDFCDTAELAGLLLDAAMSGEPRH